MNVFARFRLGPIALGMALPLIMIAAIGCGDGDRGRKSSRVNSSGSKSSQAVGDVDRRDRDAILKNVVELIRRSAEQHAGGDEFRIAKDNLNDFFQGTDPLEYQLSDASQKTIETFKNPPAKVTELESQIWNNQDARHIEDCLLYRRIALRAAGQGEDLERTRKIFEWVIQHVMLAPPDWQSLPTRDGSIPPQAQSRPYDVLLRGIAVEENLWAERSWVFMAICRQIGLDAGLLVVETPGKGQQFFCSVVLINNQAYLFDLRYGLEIPSRDRKTVATLAQAISDPGVLQYMNLPNKPYPITHQDLQSGKLIVLLDSSRGHFSPRMKLLQRSLPSEFRMLLFRDVAEQINAFMNAIGDRCEVGFWDLPIEIERRLFTDSVFNQLSQMQMIMLSNNFKLLPARMAQLLGQLKQSKTMYVNLRYDENPESVNTKKQLPPQVQRELDLYATYFLGLSQLETGDDPIARRMFEQTLKLSPEPAKGQPPSRLYRFGAQCNLARLNEREGHIAEAIRDYSVPNPSPQGFGNLIKARELSLQNPFLPPAPARSPAPVN